MTELAKKKRKLLRWKEAWEHRSAFALSVFSGVLLILAFPKYNMWWLAWVGMVPFFIAIRDKTPRLAFYLGFVFGFVFYYGNVFWLNTLIDYNEFVPVGIALLGVYLALFAAIFALLASLLRRRAAAGFSFFLIPAVWVVLEYVRSLGRLAFPWAFLSASQYKVLPLIQISDLTGTYGISYLIVLCNLALADLISAGRVRGLVRELWKPALVICLIIADLLYGSRAMKHTFADGATLKVAVVQPSVPQPTKLLSYLADDPDLQKRLQGQMIAQLVSMIRKEQGGGVDLFVLPESAITEPGFNFDVALRQMLERLAREMNACIFLGADNRSSLEENATVYNSAWLIDPQSGLCPQPYNKIQLVPFGEHVPYFSVIPFFQESIVGIGSFAEGKDYTLFPCKRLKFGAVICFESSFARLLRRFVCDGADFLVVITNDGWYERSAGAYQHNSLSVFRAIENRRYVVRAANTGISCIIAPNGGAVCSSLLYDRITLIAEIRASQHLTFYARYGDIFAQLSLVLALGVLIAVAVRGLGQRTKQQ
jgi:apolipoprotein N-acyltransferase